MSTRLVVAVTPARPSPVPAPYVECAYIAERCERLPAPLPVEEAPSEARTWRVLGVRVVAQSGVRAPAY